jgi:GNAT superfamily N-acetyltransferase
VPYHPDLDQQIVELQEVLWGPDRDRSLRYLQWKYLRNPYLADPLIRLAFHGDDLVAMRGMYGARWVAGLDGTEVTIPVGGDTVVRKDHQSRGLFRLINQALAEDLERRGLEYAFNLSAGTATSLRSQRAGWRAVPRFENVQWNPLDEGFRGASRVFDAIARALPARARMSDRPDPAGMSQVVRSLPPSPRIRHVRDEAYLTWRFLNPLSRYGFVFYDRLPMRGYLVLQDRADKRGRSRRIIDWEAREPGVARALLVAARRTDSRATLTTWTGPLVRTRSQLLAREGFRPVDLFSGEKRFVHGALVLRADGLKDADWTLNGVPLLEPDSWDLRMVYSDGF